MSEKEMSGKASSDKASSDKASCDHASGDRRTLSAEQLARMYTIDEFEATARASLSEMAYAYFAGGAGDERTLAHNRSAWEAISIWYRVMVDVSHRSTATTLMDIALPTPLLAAPTALHKLGHPDAELATVRACGAAGIPMVVSSLASTSIEEICAAATSPILMQIYISQDRGFVRELVQRAERAGCVGFQLTVDAPVWGLREREMRSGFQLPSGVDVVNLRRSGQSASAAGAGVGISQILGWTISDNITWKDLEWLCSLTKFPVMLKGVCRADDAVTAVRAGVRGIVVSNHGGRQLDGAPATAEALPHITQAVASRVPVIVDGGIRRGVDILRALALGATAVQIGRPILWGLSTAGEAGVRRVIEILASDFDRSMALAGCTGVASISRDLIQSR